MLNVEFDLTVEEMDEVEFGVAPSILVGDHTKLINRDEADQHPISAITGLAEALAESGKIDTVKVNGTALPVVDKVVDVPVPTATSELDNDSGYITASDIPTVPTKTSQLTNDSGYITDAGVTSFNGSTGAVAYTAPVASVNGQTGAVTVTEGLAPLIGTTEDILPSQVSSAIAEGRDVAISYTDGTFGELVFTAFNKAVTLNALVANTIAFYNSTLYLFELDGALAYNMWLFTYRELAQIEDLADYVPTSRTVNNKALSSNITLSASDVGALPSTTAIPTATSDLTNDSGFITSAQIPVQSVNGRTGAVTGLAEASAIPTKVSDLTNDSGYQTASDVNTAIQNALAAYENGNTSSY